MNFNNKGIVQDFFGGSIRAKIEEIRFVETFPDLALKRQKDALDYAEEIARKKAEITLLEESPQEALDRRTRVEKDLVQATPEIAELVRKQEKALWDEDLAEITRQEVYVSSLEKGIDILVPDDAWIWKCRRALIIFLVFVVLIVGCVVLRKWCSLDAFFTWGVGVLIGGAYLVVFADRFFENFLRKREWEKIAIKKVGLRKEITKVRATIQELNCRYRVKKEKLTKHHQEEIDTLMQYRLEELKTLEVNRQKAINSLLIKKNKELRELIERGKYVLNIFPLAMEKISDYLRRCLSELHKKYEECAKRKQLFERKQEEERRAAKKRAMILQLDIIGVRRGYWDEFWSLNSELLASIESLSQRMELFWTSLCEVWRKCEEMIDELDRHFLRDLSQIESLKGSKPEIIRAEEALLREMRETVDYICLIMRQVDSCLSQVFDAEEVSATEVARREKEISKAENVWQACLCELQISPEFVKKDR